jgi:hypothetical protein
VQSSGEGLWTTVFGTSDRKKENKGGRIIINTSVL